jgi:protein involved in temperature-dependent protein secretion
MDAMTAALDTGNYAQAYEAFQSHPQAKTPVGAAISAFLLAIIERWDEAEQLLASANLPALQVIVTGERQRTARWRDPDSHGSLRATVETTLVALHCAVAAAFLHGNDDLASKAKAELTVRAQPVAGKLTFVGGEIRAFHDLTDADDSIGQMLETYCGDGLLYFPFSSVRRIEVLPRKNFMDHLMPKVKITDEGGVAQAYVPLLYACSATADDEYVRSSQSTRFSYLGPARRGHGQRELVLDGSTFVGFESIAAIELDPAAA